MPHHPFVAPLVLTLATFGFTSAWAQTAPPDSRTAVPAAAIHPDAQVERRIERIRVEDTGARIDELRVGGETQSITVSPKGGMPAYEVAPASANQSPAAAGRVQSGASGGMRVWKVFGF